MSASAAARMGDEVAHGFGLMAMLAGAVVGAVIGAAIVTATAATGGMALAVVAGSIAGAGLSLGQLVKGVNRVFNLPDPTSGKLVTGSPNIRINGRPAVRAHLDIAVCSGLPMNHYPLPAVPVAEGSSSVRFNSMPAARISSKMVCGAHIKSGSNNVTIGGETQRTDTVWDTEAMAEYGLMALGIVALGAAGRAIYLLGGKIGLAKFAAGAGAGFLGFEGLGRLGDAIGPGYRDIFQGLAGVALLGAGLKSARGLLANGKGKGVVARSDDGPIFDAWGNSISRRTQSILSTFKNSRRIVVINERGNEIPVQIVENLGRRQVKVSDLGKLQAATGNEFSLLRGPNGQRILLQGQVNELAIPNKYVGNGWVWSGHSHPYSVTPSAADRMVLSAFGQKTSVIKSAANGQQQFFTQYEDLSSWLPGMN